jgi:hypothetical protein
MIRVQLLLLLLLLLPIQNLGYMFKACSIQDRYIVLKHAEAVHLTTRNPAWVWANENTWPDGIHKTQRDWTKPKGINNREYRPIFIPQQFQHLWHPYDHNNQTILIAENNSTLPKYMFSYFFDYLQYECRFQKLIPEQAQRLLGEIYEAKQKQVSPNNVELYNDIYGLYWATVYAATENQLPRGQTYVNKAHANLVKAFALLTREEKTQVQTPPPSTVQINTIL